MPAVRHLAAILAADVAGYSRLMGADEEGTYERLKAHLGELVNPKIKEHRGRVVKNTGDGFLAEFASVVDATRCAVEVQSGMAERNAAVRPEKRIEFRIGINLGDVIAHGEDIFGDGVNVAARLEALAEPGGICVGRVVRDQVRDKVDYTFEDLGEQKVKNIARPVRVYALRLQTAANASAAGAPLASLISHCARVPRLSVVVLPFTNLNNDPEQGYLADAITEDLTTDLSRIAHSFVISRNTAFTYKNKSVDTKQIGRELQVRYVLEGSVRRSGNRVRVNAQLIDAETDAHLWAERFDYDAADLFGLQDEVTSRIAVILNLELVKVEAGRKTRHPEALDYIFRGRLASAEPPSPEKYSEEIRLFESALGLDPQSVEAQSELARALMARVVDFMSNSASADIARAEGLVRRALAASPHSPLAHYARGQVLRAQSRYRDAISEYEAALAFNRNWVGALGALAWCKLPEGAIEEVIPLLERAIHLSPRDPQLGVWYIQIARVHLLQSRVDEAILCAEKACNAMPEHTSSHAYLASAYGLKGETDRAIAELAETQRLATDDRYSSINRLRATGYWGVAKVRTLFETTFLPACARRGCRKNERGPSAGVCF